MAGAYPITEETVRLADGTPVRVRMLRPEDAPLLREGFAHLSPLSRFRRFHGARRELSEAEVRYLCSPDGVGHVALGALVEQDGVEVPAAVARFIRSEARSRTAEVAITVVDGFQRRGLATLLMRRLEQRARDVGVETFELSVLTSNLPMLSWLAKTGAEVRLVGGGDVQVTLSLLRDPAPWPQPHA